MRGKRVRRPPILFEQPRQASRLDEGLHQEAGSSLPEPVLSEDEHARIVELLRKTGEALEPDAGTLMRMKARLFLGIDQQERATGN